MKKEYRYNNHGIFKDFSVEITKEDISITQFYGCVIEDCIDLPRSIFKQINDSLIKKELIEQIESIKDRLDDAELAKSNILIDQLNSNKTTSRDLARIESEIDDLFFDPNDKK